MVRLLWSPSSPSSAALPLSLVGRGGGRKEMGGVWAEEGRRWLGDSLVRGHIELQRCCGAFLSPAGRGGEGRRCSGAAASTTPWWRFVLRRRATNDEQPTRRPDAEACLRDSRRSQPLPTAKWFVPGDGKAAGDGASDPVERPRDPIAFSIFVLRSFL